MRNALVKAGERGYRGEETRNKTARECQVVEKGEMLEMGQNRVEENQETWKEALMRKKDPTGSLASTARRRKGKR